MERTSSFCGVILAAGASSRMGRDKALLPWHHGTFLSGAIEVLNIACELVVVVAGSNASQLMPVVYANAAFLAVNRAPERGQLSSLQTGLREVLNRGRDAAIVTLVDRPPATPETVCQLRDHYLAQATCGTWAVIPEYEGQHGHPIVVGREMITRFLQAPATATAREIEHQNQEHVVYLPVHDPRVIANVDTPEDYDRLAAKFPND